MVNAPGFLSGDKGGILCENNPHVSSDVDVNNTMRKILFTISVFTNYFKLLAKVFLSVILWRKLPHWIFSVLATTIGWRYP